MSDFATVWRILARERERGRLEITSGRSRRSRHCSMGILQTARDLSVQVTDDKGTEAWSSALKLNPLPTGGRHANLRSQGRGMDTVLLRTSDRFLAATCGDF